MERRVSDLANAVMVIQRHAEHKETKYAGFGSFVKISIFVINLDEFNGSYTELSSKSEYW